MCKDCGLLAHPSCAGAHLVGCDRHLVRRQMLSPSASFVHLPLDEQDTHRSRLPGRLLTQLRRHSAYASSASESTSLSPKQLHHAHSTEQKPRAAVSLADEVESAGLPEAHPVKTRSRTTSGIPGGATTSRAEKRMSMPGGLESLGSTRGHSGAAKRDSRSECVVQ